MELHHLTSNDLIIYAQFLIDVSNGNYFVRYSENEEPYSYAEGCRAPETSAIKNAVSVPVIGVSNIKNPETAERLLEDGVCDFVGVGRAHIADPEWCKKAAMGCNECIHHCIGCLYCFESLLSVGYVRCSVNPRAGREAALCGEPVKNGNGTKVAVVGGGIAGMEAAATLGNRGFEVTLYEKEEKLGGELNLASATAPYKDKLAWLTTTMQCELEAAKVKVVTGCEATPEIVKAGDPVAVFLASGGKPIMPKLPGIDSAKVVLAADVISGKVKPCGRIVIVGAGLTGLETAEKLFRDDAAECITVVDMVKQIGAGMYPAIFVDVTHQMEGKPLSLLASRKLKEVTEAGIVVENLEECKDEIIEADCIILAMGTRVDNATIQAFEDTFDCVICLGQTHKNPGRIATSMTEGYIAARGFDPVA